MEVFPGNTGDPSTVAAQVKKIQGRFGIESIALVGDRGMLTTARLREDLSPAGLAWISALRSDGIRKLMRPPKPGGKGDEPAPLRPGELVPDGIAEILSPEFPGERLLVCLNPRLRQERARKREELLSATEKILETIASAVRSRHARLRGRQAINRRVGRDVSRKKVDKHFLIEETDDDVRWSRRQEKIDAEAQLDGIYIIRTSLEASDIGPAEAVEAYKSLSQVKRAFRSLKTAQFWPCTRSSSTARIMCAGTSFCVCWRITWNGTCGGVWRRCCSRRRIDPGRERCGPHRWKRRWCPSGRRLRPDANGRLTGSLSTASGRCWRILARSP